MESKSTEVNLEMIHTSSWQILAMLPITTTYEPAYLALNAVTIIFQTTSIWHKAKSSTVQKEFQAHPHGTTLTKLQLHPDLHIYTVQKDP